MRMLNFDLQPVVWKCTCQMYVYATDLESLGTKTWQHLVSEIVTPESLGLCVAINCIVDWTMVQHIVQGMQSNLPAQPAWPPAQSSVQGHAHGLLDDLHEKLVVVDETLAQMNTLQELARVQMTEIKAIVRRMQQAQQPHHVQLQRLMQQVQRVLVQHHVMVQQHEEQQQPGQLENMACLLIQLIAHVMNTHMHTTVTHNIQ